MKVLIAALLTLSVCAPAFAKECKNGKACGNACIAKTAVCRSETPVPTATPSPTPAKNCKTGKACGNTCIAQDAVCKKN